MVLRVFLQTTSSIFGAAGIFFISLTKDFSSLHWGFLCLLFSLLCFWVREVRAVPKDINSQQFVKAYYYCLGVLFSSGLLMLLVVTLPVLIWSGIFTLENLKILHDQKELVVSSLIFLTLFFQTSKGDLVEMSYRIRLKRLFG